MFTQTFAREGNTIFIKYLTVMKETMQWWHYCIKAPSLYSSAGSVRLFFKLPISILQELVSFKIGLGHLCSRLIGRKLLLQIVEYSCFVKDSVGLWRIRRWMMRQKRWWGWPSAVRSRSLGGLGWQFPGSGWHKYPCSAWHTPR